MEITEKTTMKELAELPAFAPMKNAFVGTPGDWRNVFKDEWTFEDITKNSPTWYYGDIVYGVKRLYEVAESGEEYVFSLYSEEEIEADPAKRQVRLIYHPAEAPRTDLCALLLSGGGYGAVCTLAESMPVAARLNDLGVTAFSLNYRTATEESMKVGLIPKPLEDVARAIRFMKERFSIDPDKLIVGGFSAGGHLAGLWGAKYAEYGLNKPLMLMLDYPLVTYENYPEGIANMLAGGLLGAAALQDREKMQTMSVHRLVTGDFPKTYIVTALDDDTVPAQDSRDLEEALCQENIPHLVERVEHGGHGFGLGSVTQAAGWVDRALAFAKEDL